MHFIKKKKKIYSLSIEDVIELLEQAGNELSDVDKEYSYRITSFHVKYFSHGGNKFKECLDYEFYRLITSNLTKTMGDYAMFGKGRVAIEDDADTMMEEIKKQIIMWFE